MKQVSFSKQVIVTRTYETSMKEFLDHHFREAHKYGDELDLCVQSGTNSHCIVPALTVKLLPEELLLDFSEMVNVKLVLKRHLKDTIND